MTADTQPIRLWLDDIRDPAQYGHLGYGNNILAESNRSEATADNGEPPRSQLGKLLPFSRVHKGQVLIAMKTFFDKSGSEEAKFMTLAGIAAQDVAFGEVEKLWNYMLHANTPEANYMHMVEAVHLNREFEEKKGWNHENVLALINWLASYITDLPRATYCQFLCTVDMEAYRKLQAETYQMDSPVDICNEWCVEAVMHWYTFLYKGGLDYEASYFFDTGEPFEPIFKAKWERELDRDQHTGAHGMWSHIKQVGTAPMRSTPGLQIADMLAWGVNRGKTMPAASSPLPPEYEHIGLMLTRLAPTYSELWDESRLRKAYRPLIYKP